ncbi:hypothetical protein D3C74_182610 [compost metagenome]
MEDGSLRMAKYSIRINYSDKLNSKQAIRHIEQEILIGEGRFFRIHMIWKLCYGAIMVHEYTSDNYPSSSVCF